jgi:hypothetical protein
MTQRSPHEVESLPAAGLARASVEGLQFRAHGLLSQELLLLPHRLRMLVLSQRTLTSARLGADWGVAHWRPWEMTAGKGRDPAKGWTSDRPGERQVAQVDLKITALGAQAHLSSS